MSRATPASPLRPLVADDEPLARASLAALLRPWDRWSAPLEAANGSQVLELLESNPVDALFLDIRMPGLDGLELARHLSGLDAAPGLVFVTAYEHHALEAFDLDAVDYLLKPVAASRFERMLHRLEGWIDQRGERSQRSPAPPRSSPVEPATAAPVASPEAPLRRLVVRTGNRYRFVDTENLLWIGSDGNYVRLYLGDRCLLHRATLATLERQLDPEVFLRVQRGAIVNRREILEVRRPASGRYCIVLRDGSQVDVSQRYSRRVLSRLGIGDGGT